jgi:peptidoglycan/LPS O-acetylase OafA/YrhL
LLGWLSPFAYTLFLTHVFIFTFFSQAWTGLFGEPVFFGISGVLYIVMMLVSAVVAAIVLKSAWTAMVARVRARA